MILLRGRGRLALEDGILSVIQYIVKVTGLWRMAIKLLHSGRRSMAQAALEWCLWNVGLENSSPLNKMLSLMKGCVTQI
jgi:hypothetical protein